MDRGLFQLFNVLIHGNAISQHNILGFAAGNGIGIERRSWSRLVG